MATFQTTTLSVGPHTNITAVYDGDANNLGSTSSSVSDDVSEADAQTFLTSSVNPSVYGQPVTYTATVSPVAPSTGTPTGTVIFYENLNSIGTGTESSPGVWTLTITTNSIGAFPDIWAGYGGDGNFGSSASHEDATQVVNQASTHSNVLTSVSPSVWGQSVTFTATVAADSSGAGTPTGTVTFMDSGEPDRHRHPQ